jgi:hypothetical protein
MNLAIFIKMSPTTSNAIVSGISSPLLRFCHCCAFAILPLSPLLEQGHTCNAPKHNSVIRPPKCTMPELYLAQIVRSPKGTMPDMNDARDEPCPTGTKPDRYKARHEPCPTCTMPDESRQKAGTETLPQANGGDATETVVAL